MYCAEICIGYVFESFGYVDVEAANCKNQIGYLYQRIWLVANVASSAIDSLDEAVTANLFGN